MEMAENATQETAEFQSYLQSASTESHDCIQHWQANKLIYPKLFQLHLQHHVIPATSAAIERTFSVAGLICNDRRNRLEDNMFELLVVAKSNKDHL